MAPDEVATFEELKSHGGKVRFVTVPSHYEYPEREDCTAAYSLHKELIEPYENGHLIVPGKRLTKGVDSVDDRLEESPLGTPLPFGHTLKKAGPYFRLIDSQTGKQVHKKALHKAPMEKLIKSMWYPTENTMRGA